MGAWVAGGGVVDLVLAVTLLEAALLLLWHRFKGRGVAPREFALNLTSGLLLVLAMRGYLHAVPWPWTALCLAGAGLAHTADIVRRWR